MIWRYIQLLGAVLGVYCLGAVACQKKPDGDDPRYFTIHAIGLQVPRLINWTPDPSIQVQDPAKGGIFFRLAREGAVVGSPRVDVVVEPLGVHATILEDFLRRNLQQMGTLESQGKLRILHVDERPISVGPRPAYRVRHEYVTGSGSTQIAVTQVSVFLVLDGRGVTVTAAGRTELFHPVSNDIEAMTNGLRTPPMKNIPRARVFPEGTEKNSPVQTVPKTQPIDLGKL